jgi:hypothetical protein
MIKAFRVHSHLGDNPFIYYNLDRAKRDVLPEFSVMAEGITDAEERFIIEEFDLDNFKTVDDFLAMERDEQFTELITSGVARQYSFTRPAKN